MGDLHERLGDIVVRAVIVPSRVGEVLDRFDLKCRLDRRHYDSLRNLVDLRADSDSSDFTDTPRRLPFGRRTLR